MAHGDSLRVRIESHKAGAIVKVVTCSDLLCGPPERGRNAHHRWPSVRHLIERVKHLRSQSERHRIVHPSPQRGEFVGQVPRLAMAVTARCRPDLLLSPCVLMLVEDVHRPLQTHPMAL